MQGIIGFMMTFPGNFAPANWLFCHGQILNVWQYQALYSIIGNIYGGNGTATFALPDLRGRVPVGSTGGAVFPFYPPGHTGGIESVALTVEQLPVHKHVALAYDGPAHRTTPGNCVWAMEPTGGTGLYTHAVPNGEMNETAMEMTGSGLRHWNLQPYLGINYIICVEGLYPQRP